MSYGKIKSMSIKGDKIVYSMASSNDDRGYFRFKVNNTEQELKNLFCGYCGGSLVFNWSCISKFKTALIKAKKRLKEKGLKLDLIWEAYTTKECFLSNIERKNDWAIDDYKEICDFLDLPFSFEAVEYYFYYTFEVFKDELKAALSEPLEKKVYYILIDGKYLNSILKNGYYIELEPTKKFTISQGLEFQSWYNDRNVEIKVA